MMFFKIPGRWRSVVFLVYILLPGSTSHLDDDYVSEVTTSSRSWDHDESTTAERDVTFHHGRYPHPHHTHSTAFPREEQRPPLIFPTRKVYVENETEEFKCLAPNATDIKWYTSLRQPWSRWKELGSPVEKFKNFFSVVNTTNITDNKLLSTIKVRMDPSLDKTMLICSVVGRSLTSRVQVTIQKPRKQLGDTCATNEDCAENTICTKYSTCDCDKFHFRRQYNYPKVYSCAPRKLGLGTACSRDENCPSHSICDRVRRVCICEHSYVPNYDGWDPKCVSAQHFLGVCRQDFDCQRWDRNAVCKIHSCNCADGYVYTEGKCWRKVWLGDPCHSNEDCSAIVEHSICRNVTSGGFAECSCEVGYRISGRRCVAHWREHILSLKVYFIICASTLGIVLLCIFVYGIKSARILMMQKKGRNYRTTIANEKNLSISKYMPMKSKPDLKVLKEKQSVTFCPLPALDLAWKTNQRPELRPVAISEEDRTVGIPENLILIQNRNSEDC